MKHRICSPELIKYFAKRDDCKFAARSDHMNIAKALIRSSNFLECRMFCITLHNDRFATKEKFGNMRVIHIQEFELLLLVRT
ncbi:hypothetical protein WL27_11220 [Burkholderia multivorans]|nr:hypothetical protein WL27_11220 [Burkholderia multivorans]